VLEMYHAALSGRRPLVLQHGDGHEQRHDVARWVDDADPVDRRLLDHCTGATVDLGCGPGRLVAELTRRGMPALGVDASVRAVAMARRRGAAAVVRDLFEPLPGEGRWDCALLADGNIGIGGDPSRLLARTGRLLRPGGRLLVEVSPDDVFRLGPARLIGSGGQVSGSFGWAELGAPALSRLASVAGWQVGAERRDGRRCFVILSRPGSPIDDSSTSVTVADEMAEFHLAHR
jgi:SAM-dependent methyltransferase